ncbi:MAG: response regulator [Pirellulales bacterium]|nr:response regulator [Pirellulales bacterium]
MPRILVADDDADARERIAAILQKEPVLSVVFAADGTEAMAEFDKAKPDLLLTDLRMPNMDGLDLVRAVRDRCESTPIVMMTSHGDQQLAAQALSAGAASYVPKSEAEEELLNTVQHVLNLSTRRSLRPFPAELKQSRMVYVIHNDSQMITSLVGHLQENILQVGLCDESEQIRFGVALEEALINAMIHGNLEIDSSIKENDPAQFDAMVQQRCNELPYKERKIEVEVELSAEQIVVTIGDHGQGFDPTTLPDPTEPENLEKVSGRGVLLMRSFMDEVQFNDAGNRVTMIKRKK